MRSGERARVFRLTRIGESMPDTVKPDSFDSYYGSDYLCRPRHHVRQSYVAWRVYDVAHLD